MAVNIRNCREFMEHCLHIKTKDGKIIPFRMNEHQKRLYDRIAERFDAKKPVRIIVLKARQMGISTFSEGLGFWMASTRANVDEMIMAHTDEATSNLFAMHQLFYDTLPEPIRPQLKASNAKELRFDKPARSKSPAPGLRSRIRCATAGGQGVGRSWTIQFLHMSEFAFWPGDKLDTYTGLMQAVPEAPGTVVIIESTANGYEEFHDLWEQAVQDWNAGNYEGFEPVFFPWFEMQEYRRKPGPGFQLTKEEKEVQKAFHLDLEQMAWRRHCIKTQCGGSLDLFHQEYPATPEEAFISTGSCIFDKEAINLRIKRTEKTRWEKGQFEFDYDDSRPAGQKIRNIRWVKSEDGMIRIRKQPEERVPYVLGGDTAGEGSDWFTGHILDNRTGSQAAVLRQQSDETAYVRQMYCLGMFYNKALMGIETNYSTYETKELERLGYPNQFIRQVEDSYTGKMRKSFGVATTSITRPLMLDNLKAVAQEHLGLIWDRDTLDEMLRFVRNKAGRAEAAAGAHDDLVMGLAIAHYIRPQQSCRRKPEPGKRKKWTEDMWEDFLNADPEGQAYLLKKWGQPE